MLLMWVGHWCLTCWRIRMQLEIEGSARQCAVQSMISCRLPQAGCSITSREVGNGQGAVLTTDKGCGLWVPSAVAATGQQMMHGFVTGMQTVLLGLLGGVWILGLLLLALYIALYMKD